MANQKKIDRKLKELEEQYVEKTLAKQFKAEEVKGMYHDAQQRIKAKYAKVLLKASLNEEEAKELATLKRKRIGLKLAKAGAAILKGLGIGAIVLLPVALGVGAGILAGIGIAGGLAGATTAGMAAGGVVGGIAGGLSEFLVYCASERANNWLRNIGQERLDDADDSLWDNDRAIDKINGTIYDQAQTALDGVVAETEARIQQDKRMVTRQRKENPPNKDEQYSVREEAINKFRTAVALARQTEVANPIVGEQPEA